MVYFTSDKLGWKVQIQPWINELPESLKAEWRAPLIKHLFEFMLPKVIKYLFEDSEPAVFVH
jgi:hypothetical protein